MTDAYFAEDSRNNGVVVVVNDNPKTGDINQNSLSMAEFTFDLYDEPGLIMDVINKNQEAADIATIEQTKASGGQKVGIFAMRSSATFVSPAIFEEYVWPALKATMIRIQERKNNKKDTIAYIIYGVKKILIAEDESNIAQMISMCLSKNGYMCKTAPDGEAAASMIEEEYFDLALLDVMMPGIDGFELISYVKQYGIPVIFVTAKVSVDDRVKGLKLGADDYILKPFDLKELLARVEVVLRRYGTGDSIIKVGDIEINTMSHHVTRGGNKVTLSTKEYDLLLYFITNENIALSRECIYEHVWKEPYYGSTRTVDLHVLRIRQKLGLEDMIQSIYKVGYLFSLGE